MSGFDALKKIGWINRGTLMAFLGLDLLLIGASAYIVWHRFQMHWEAPAETVQPAPQTAPAEAAPPAEEAVREETPAPSQSAGTGMRQGRGTAPEPALEPKPARAAPQASGPARKILFKYRDSIPKRVVIVGDFNGWSPQLMKKDAKNNWTLVLNLKPGSYAYNFVVDGRMIRDPSNKKTKQAGQKIPSSYLTVKNK